MTMQQEAERLNEVLVSLREQYKARWHARANSYAGSERLLAALEQARDVASQAWEDWSAGRLREAVNGYCDALLVLRQV
jgi:hypothetical protein